jgi:2-amino-4-hydroxy-6-hydroxymethyldihydropteridine diphosphokinase
MVRSFVGLGSNVGDPRAHLEGALTELPVVRASRFYRTAPLGGPPQAWYVNAVAEIGFDDEPEDLLRVCRSIESRHGRTRTFRNAPRTLDIDILLFGDRVVDTNELTIPHPRVRERRFVLVPMVEIAPEVHDPVSGLSMRDLLSLCPDESAVELL